MTTRREANHDKLAECLRWALGRIDYLSADRDDWKRRANKAERTLKEITAQRGRGI